MEETRAFSQEQQSEFLRRNRRLPPPPRFHLDFDDFPPEEARENPEEYAVNTVEREVKRGARSLLRMRHRFAFVPDDPDDTWDDSENDDYFYAAPLVSRAETGQNTTYAGTHAGGLSAASDKSRKEYNRNRFSDIFSHIRNAVRNAVEGINRVKLATISVILSLLFLLLLTTLIGLFAASPFGIFLTGEAAEKDSVPLSVAIHSVNEELNAKLEPLQHKKDYDEIHLTGDVIDWLDVLAVYAVHEHQSGLVYSLDSGKVADLSDMYWSMVSVSTEDKKIPHIEKKTTTGPNGKPVTSFVITYTRELFIDITCKSAEERARELGFSAKETESMQQLLSLGDSLYDTVGSLSVVDATAKQAIHDIPLDTAQDRYLVAKTACGLVGKVSYFWGGKSYARGWDSRWGQLREVTSEGSDDTGLYMPYGLDCTGFVNWAFFNALGKTGLSGSTIPLSCARVGDLVYTPAEDHVGIVLSVGSNGPTRIIHCAKGYNGVAITDAGMFDHAVSPAVYGS